MLTEQNRREKYLLGSLLGLFKFPQATEALCIILVLALSTLTENFNATPFSATFFPFPLSCYLIILPTDVLSETL